MFIEIDPFTVLVLIIVFMTLYVVSSQRKRPSHYRKEERRAYPRYKTSLRIKYKTAIEEGISWIKDISEGGARLFLNSTLRALGMGEPLEIEINLPDETKPISILGSIIWTKEDDAGFKFDKVIEGDIARIIEYIKHE